MTASLAKNIANTRRSAGITQEELAGKIGVSRQTVSDWERGDATPDLANAQKLAHALGVSLDDLTTFNAKAENTPVPPRGKHIFGTVTVGERGQIVIPKAARDLFRITPGDSLIVLGDEEQGIAITKTETFLAGVDELRTLVNQMQERAE
ncbi:MAG: helix-turn-helix domain-containing protein [Eggerthellaceae bacterium]